MPATLTTVDPGADRWVRIETTRDAYDALDRGRGDRARPRLTYLDGRLTVVSPGHTHESLGSRLTGMIHEILVGPGVDGHASCQVRLQKSEGSREGTEPDASSYFHDLERVRDKRDLVMGVDPPPGLVVEVVVSHPADDALEAYRRFRVREVWVCRPTGLEFLLLGDDGSYAPSPVSACLPAVLASELSEWLDRRDLASDTRLWSAFRAWVGATLVPRQRPDA